MITLLLWIGLIRRKPDGTIRWPFSTWPREWWSVMWRSRPLFGVFRNLPGVIKWEPGRLLPRRWGVRFWVFEFGDRG